MTRSTKSRPGLFTLAAPRSLGRKRQDGFSCRRGWRGSPSGVAPFPGTEEGRALQEPTGQSTRSFSIRAAPFPWDGRVAASWLPYLCDQPMPGLQFGRPVPGTEELVPAYTTSRGVLPARAASLRPLPFPGRKRPTHGWTG